MDGAGREVCFHIIVFLTLLATSVKFSKRLAIQNVTNKISQPKWEGPKQLFQNKILRFSSWCPRTDAEVVWPAAFSARSPIEMLLPIPKASVLHQLFKGNAKICSNPQFEIPLDIILQNWKAFSPLSSLPLLGKRKEGWGEQNK